MIDLTKAARAIALVCLAVAMSAASALAAPPSYVNMSNGLPATTVPAALVDANGNQIGTVGNPLPVTVGSGQAGSPYVLTSTGFQNVGSFSTSTGFTPPATSTVCFIQAEGNPVRFRTDGVAPTATVGQLLATGSVLQETAALSTIKFIPTTGNATLDVDCYK